jgi:hypothetical protein
MPWNEIIVASARKQGDKGSRKGTNFGSSKPCFGGADARQKQRMEFIDG